MAAYIEGWSFNRTEAAEIVGLTDKQLSNWMNRYRLLEAKQRGSGHRVDFVLRDILHVAGVKALVHAGIEPQNAVNALRSYSLQGHLYSPPGLFPLAPNSDGVLIGMDGADLPLTIYLRVKAIFDALWPAFCGAVLANPHAYDPRDLENDLCAYKARVDLLYERFEGSTHAAKD